MSSSSSVGPSSAKATQHLADDGSDRVEVDARDGADGGGTERVAGDQRVDPEAGREGELVLAHQSPVQPARLAVAQDAGGDLDGGQLARDGVVGAAAERRTTPPAPARRRSRRAPRGRDRRQARPEARASARSDAAMSPNWRSARAKASASETSPTIVSTALFGM